MNIFFVGESWYLVWSCWSTSSLEQQPLQLGYRTQASRRDSTAQSTTARRTDISPEPLTTLLLPLRASTGNAGGAPLHPLARIFSLSFFLSLLLSFLFLLFWFRSSLLLPYATALLLLLLALPFLLVNSRATQRNAALYWPGIVILPLPLSTSVQRVYWGCLIM